jgi:hypothetical protein
MCHVKFHIVGGKCRACRSYNTARMGEELIDEVEEHPAQEEGIS